MVELNLTGGARVGWLKSSYAELKITKDKLELNTLISNYIFQPADIISIEPSNSMVFIGQAIKINHRVNKYSKSVIFYTNTKEAIINQIEKTGFLINEEVSEPRINRTIIDKQVSRGFPLKTSFVIGVIILCILLLLTDIITFILGNEQGFPFGKGALSAIALLFLISSLSLISKGFRGMILKEGQELNDIKKFALLAMIAGGIMLFNLVLITKLFN